MGFLETKENISLFFDNYNTYILYFKIRILLKYLKILISNSQDASSRRLIAVLTLPFYWGAIVTGLILAFKSENFKIYIAALIASGLPIYLSYFALTWEGIVSILSTKAFQKKSDGLYELTPDQQIDP